MITANDLRKIAVWSFNLNLEAFAKVVYATPKSKINAYHRDKFRRFREDPLALFGELGDLYLDRVSKAINSYEG